MIKFYAPNHYTRCKIFHRFIVNQFIYQKFKKKPLLYGDIIFRLKTSDIRYLV